MTTYTPAATIATDPNDPVTSEVGTALKNNPLAIAEGDVTAPRISALANGPILDYQTFSRNLSSGRTICQIDLGVARFAVIRVINGFTANALNDPGSSQYRIRGSLNGSSWTNLVTFDTAGSSATLIFGPAVWDGRGGTAYRYYQVYGDGEGGHNIVGRCLIECIGTEDES